MSDLQPYIFGRHHGKENFNKGTDEDKIVLQIFLPRSERQSGGKQANISLKNLVR